MTRQMSPQEQARLDSMKRNWQQRRAISEKLGKIDKKIGVYSGKGGVGKTTTAVNLSASLAAAEKNVLLVDLDPQGNATVGAGIEITAEEATVYDILSVGARGTISAWLQYCWESAICSRILPASPLHVRESAP